MTSAERQSEALEGFELVARVEELGEGDLLPVETASGEKICLLRHRGAVRAVSDVCTHQDFAMSHGVVLPGERCVIECAWHGARFDCETGAVRQGPALDPLPVFEVLEHEGGIWVGGRVQ